MLQRLKELAKLKSLLLKLDQRAIAEIKSMNAPIQDIKDIVAAMLLLLGASKKEVSNWKSMKSVIGKFLCSSVWGCGEEVGSWCVVLF